VAKKTVSGGVSLCGVWVSTALAVMALAGFSADGFIEEGSQDGILKAILMTRSICDN
jgi:hypothetical protein